MEENIKCPCCQKSYFTLKLYYGLLSVEIIQAIHAGKIAIGKAILWPDRPTHVCTTCHVQFSEIKNYGVWNDSFKTIHKILADAA